MITLDRNVYIRLGMMTEAHAAGRVTKQQLEEMITGILAAERGDNSQYLAAEAQAKMRREMRAKLITGWRDSLEFWMFPRRAMKNSADLAYTAAVELAHISTRTEHDCWS